MKTYLSVLAAVLATAAVAHAEPAVTANAQASEPTIASYLQLGAIGGANDDYATMGASLEGGKRITRMLWIHGMVVGGRVDGPFLSSGSGAFQQLRVGVETHGCISSGMACVNVGIDAGIQHVAWSGQLGHFDFDGDGSGAQTMTTDRTLPVVIPRIGLDLGGRHLRFRPGFELPIASNGVNGADATLAIAYLW